MDGQNNNGQPYYQGEQDPAYGMYPYPMDAAMQPPMTAGQYASYPGAPMFEPHMIYPPNATWPAPGGDMYQMPVLQPPQASTSQAGAYASDSLSPPENAPKKRGRKPLPGAAERRKEQNRQAQKTFREKRETYLRDLEATAASATENYRQIFGLITSLSDENNSLRTGLGRPQKDILEMLKASPLHHLYETFQNKGTTGASDSEQSSTRSRSSKAPRKSHSGSASGTQSSASDGNRPPNLPHTLPPISAVMPHQHDYRPPLPPVDSSVTGTLPYDP